MDFTRIRTFKFDNHGHIVGHNPDEDEIARKPKVSPHTVIQQKTQAQWRCDNAEALGLYDQKIANRGLLLRGVGRF